jgi:hypothetical protein
MSNEIEETEEKRASRLSLNRDSIIDAILARAEKYGLATILLLMLLYWAKPHVDEMIHSHNKLIEKTVEVQARQSDTLETATKTLERVDRISVDTNTIVREMKGVGSE